MKGKLYGVSVGPGDPELLTLRAARVLESADVVAAPKVGESGRIALRIAEPYIAGKPVLDCATPMTRDRAATDAAYDDIADDITALLEAGKSVAFVTLGDASVYSTWSYVCERMEGRGFEVEVVPGVPSFCAAAAVLREPLCERAEQLLVSPASSGDTAAALDVPGTKVFMKAGRHLGELRAALEERGLAGDASLVANCGLPGQVVVRDLSRCDELPGYLSVVLVKDSAGGVGPGPAPEECPRDASAPGAVHGCGRPQQRIASENASLSARFVVVARQTNESSQMADGSGFLAGCAKALARPDEDARRRARDKWNAVAKPIGSLGVLEEAVVRIAALTGTTDVRLGKRAVAVLCADNGVVAEGVSQCGQEVTAAVAENIARGVSSVCVMAKTARADVFAFDLGMAHPPEAPGIVDLHVARGTGNIAQGPAMTRDQALQAIEAGVGIVADLKARGYGIVASGEMGIGNTTTSSAMASVLLGLPAADATGRGAGLSDAGLQRKVDAIKRAIAVNDPNPDDALDVLAKLGGFDIAGMAGLFIGGAIHQVPIVIDGFISAVAAYVATRIAPGCECAMIASHVSAEPAARLLLDALGLKPAIDAGMRLGEGTGAVCLFSLLDAALALYHGTTFQHMGIDAYDPNLSQVGHYLGGTVSQ